MLKAGSDAELQDRLEASLERMARRGELGMGVTEHRLRGELASRLPDLFQRYRDAVTRWPEPVAEPVTLEYHYHNDTGSVQLLDLIDGLRTGPDGRLCRLVVARSSLLAGSGAGRRVRYANLMTDWLVHLAVNWPGNHSKP